MQPAVNHRKRELKPFAHLGVPPDSDETVCTVQRFLARFSEDNQPPPLVARDWHVIVWPVFDVWTFELVDAERALYAIRRGPLGSIERIGRFRLVAAFAGLRGARLNDRF